MNFWKLTRYMICGLVAFWGFFLIFKNGDFSAGKTLLIIASIGAVATFLIDLIKSKRRNGHK